MIKIVFALLILQVYSQNCIDLRYNECYECDSSTFLIRFSCVFHCPTHCPVSGSTCSCDPGDRVVFDLKFFEVTDVSLTSIGEFHTPGNIQFQDPSRKAPVPASQRGFYFDSQSSLETDQNYIPGDSYTINLWAKINSGGNILEAASSDRVYVRMYYSNDNVRISYARFEVCPTCTNDYRFRTFYASDPPSDYGKWNRISYGINRSETTCNQMTGINTSMKNDYPVIDCWIRVESNDLSWKIGKSSSGDSFVGFLYRLEFRNSHGIPSDDYGTLLSCDVNQIVSGGSCSAASHSCTIPDCIPCATYCSTCSSFPWLCKPDSCVAGRTYVEGICMKACPSGFSCPSTNPEASFEEDFSKFPSELSHFKSGSDSSTYYPYNSPDSDDPIPLKLRGYYFTDERYLESINNLNLNVNFSVAMWVMPITSGSILSKGDRLDITDSRVGMISDTLLGTRYDISESMSISSNTWYYFVFTYKFDYILRTEVNIYIDNSLRTSDTRENMILLLPDSTFIIGKGGNFFLYSLKLFQKEVTDYSSEYCISGNKNDCFSTCGLDQYQDDSGNCQACKDDCNQVCVRSTDCNPCFDDFCGECTSFADGTCSSCVPNASDTSNCTCNVRYFKDADECKPCTDNCDQCTSTNFTSCTYCSENYFLIQEVCHPFCPSGFTANSANRTCELNEHFAFYLKLNKILDTVNDTQSNIPVRTGADNSFYPQFDTTDPLPSKDRGYYFTNSSFMHLPSPSLLIGPWFTLSVWAKPLEDHGTLLSKQDTTANTKLKLGVTSGRLNFEMDIKNSTAPEPLEERWNALVVGTYLNSTVPEVLVFIYINGVEVLLESSGTDWFHDLQTSFHLTLGAEYLNSTTLGNFFKGFIWEVRVYNSYKDSRTLLEISGCKDCSICPLDNSKKCLSDCSITEYSDGENCQPCDESCTNGCVKESTCNLCAKSICKDCEGFEESDCIECKENAGNPPCDCIRDFGLDRLELNCIPCSGGLYRTVHEKKCLCASGFYNSDPEGINCNKCGVECSQCSPPELDCVQCKVTDSYINPEGNCVCPGNSVIANNTCTCPAGTYLACSPNCNSPSVANCNKCHSSCETCSGPLGTDCLSCEDAYLHEDRTCGPCQDGTYLEEENCLECDDMCETCESLEVCTSCIENAYLNSNSTCVCEFPFFVNQTVCQRDYFYASISIDKDNEVTVSFTDSLQKDLSKSDFQFSLKNQTINYEFSVEKTSSNEYKIEMEFKGFVSEGEEMTLEFKNPLEIMSVSELVLHPEPIKGSLSLYSPGQILMEAVAATAATAATGAVSAGAGSSILTPNPAGLWAILNTVEILSYIPVTNNRLTPTVTGLFKGFGSINPLPNVFEYFIDPDLGMSTSLAEKKNGLKSSLFLVNAGQALSAFFLVILLYPVIWVFSKCKYEEVRNKFKKMLGGYKYGVFIRYWIQCYFDLALAVIIQLTSLPSIDYIPIISYTLACICGVSLLVTPPLIVRFCRRKAVEIRRLSEESAFYRIYGSFFYEFKADGSTLCKYSYVVFLLKRLIFAASLVLLGEFPVLQAAVNFVCMVSYAVFLVVVKPYNEAIMQVINSIVEVGVSLIFLAVSYFLQTEVTDYDQLIESIIFYITMGLILVQSLGSILTLGVVIYEFLKQKCTSTKVQPSSELISEVVELNDNNQSNTVYEIPQLAFFRRKRN